MGSTKSEDATDNDLKVTDKSYDLFGSSVVDGFRIYNRRWFVLATVALLNMSINALWISFSSIASSVAFYYNVNPSGVDLLSGIGFAVGIPVSIAMTYSVDRLGLR